MKYLALICLLLLLSSPCLAQQEPIMFVYFDSFPPYSWKENGKMKGILIDIANAIAKEMKIEIRHEGYPWKRAQAYIKDGNADAMITFYSKCRQEYVVALDKSVCKAEVKLFIPRSSRYKSALKNICSLEELKRYQIVDYLGNGWIQERLEIDDSYNFQQLTTAPLTYRFLAANRADVLLDDKIVGRYIIEKENLTDRIEELPCPFDSYDMHICISKKSSYITKLKEFNQALSKLKNDGSVDKILKNWR